MKPLLAILLLLSLPVLAEQRTNSITLAWDWTPPAGESITNYVFLLRSTNNLSALQLIPTNIVKTLPWPVIGQTTGMLQLATSVAMTNGETRFYYVGVTDRRSCPTNYIAESPPSNVVRHTLLPGVENTTIGP